MDSSHSRTYLTSRNNRYNSAIRVAKDPADLEEVRKRNRKLQSLGRNKQTSERYEIASMAPSEDDVIATIEVEHLDADAGDPPMSSSVDEEDIHRPPTSSSDEAEPSRSTNTHPAAKQTSQPGLPQTSSKRAFIQRSERSRKSKMLKLARQEVMASTMPETEPAFVAPPDDFLTQFSQTSQRKGRQKTYGKRTLFRVPSGSFESPASARNNPLLKIKTLSSSPVSSLAIDQDPLVMAAPPLSSIPDVLGSFKVYASDDDENDPTASTSNSDLLKNTLFCNADTTTKPPRGSTSSLSSVGSLGDYLLTKDQKEVLMTDSEPLPSTHFRCPLCHQSSLKADMGTYLRHGLTSLTHSQRTKLCHSHRIRDARISWTEKEYPVINWHRLEDGSRVAPHLKHLQAILQRRVPSYYLTKLDEAIADARSNQGKVKRYFDFTALSLIRHGYYGPRGVKLIANVLSKDPTIFKLATKCRKGESLDKAFRIAGFSRLVDVVILPEILCKLVCEDMGFEQSDDEKARAVLTESEDLGALLHPDDDELRDAELDEVVLS